MEPRIVHGGPADKAALRERVLVRLRQFPEEARRKEEAVLCALLEDEALKRGFEVVLATLPLKDEPVLLPFFDRWLSLGLRLALARTEPDRGLGFRFVSDLKGPWEAKKGGLREPSAEGPRWVPGRPTLCLVPGLAFCPRDGRIARLGRGGGYYDRWLEKTAPHVTTWGTGFSVQREPWLPQEPHDQTLDDWKHG